MSRGGPMHRSGGEPKGGLAGCGFYLPKLQLQTPPLQVPASERDIMAALLRTPPPQGQQAEKPRRRKKVSRK